MSPRRQLTEKRAYFILSVPKQISKGFFFFDNSWEKNV